MNNPEFTTAAGTGVRPIAWHGSSCILIFAGRRSGGDSLLLIPKIPNSFSAHVIFQIDLWMLFLKGSHVLFSSLHRLPEIGPTQLIGTWVPLCKLGATWIRLDNVVFNGVAQLGVREDRSIEPHRVALAGFLNCQARIYS